MNDMERERPSAAGKQPGAEKPVAGGGYDVEFSLDEADEDDLEALARAEAAERRVRRKEGRKP